MYIYNICTCTVYMYILSFPANDKAWVLNEIGRMFLVFGDRSSAGRYFRQSALTAKPDHQNCHNLKEQNASMKSAVESLYFRPLWDSLKCVIIKGDVPFQDRGIPL